MRSPPHYCDHQIGRGRDDLLRQMTYEGLREDNLPAEVRCPMQTRVDYY